MPTFKTVADATRSAAEGGGRLDVGGRIVNAGGDRVRAMPRMAPEPAAAPPAPVIQPGMSEAEVRQLIEQRDEAWRLQLDALQHQIDILTGLQQSGARRVPWTMRATYFADGRIDQLVATPQEH